MYTDMGILDYATQPKTELLSVKEFQSQESLKKVDSRNEEMVTHSEK